MATWEAAGAAAWVLAAASAGPTNIAAFVVPDEHMDLLTSRAMARVVV
jgi:hypothetical protein